MKSAQSTPSKVEAKSGFKLVNYHDDTVLSDDESDSSNDDNDGNGEKADENLEQDVDMEATKDNAKDTITKRDRAAEYGFQLPPETKGKCPQELQDKITNMYDKMRTNNMDMNKLIQQRKEFRNPSIYEKLIQFCEIDELGTNYPPELYDPLQWTGKLFKLLDFSKCFLFMLLAIYFAGKDSFYEELAMVQKLEMEKREKEMSKAEPMKKAEDDSKKRFVDSLFFRKCICCNTKYTYFYHLQKIKMGSTVTQFSYSTTADSNKTHQSDNNKYNRYKRYCYFSIRLIAEKIKTVNYPRQHFFSY